MLILSKRLLIITVLSTFFVSDISMVAGSVGGAPKLGQSKAVVATSKAPTVSAGSASVSKDDTMTILQRAAKYYAWGVLGVGLPVAAATAFLGAPPAGAAIAVLSIVLGIPISIVASAIQAARK